MTQVGNPVGNLTEVTRDPAVSLECKNLMIVGTRHRSINRAAEIDNEIAEIKRFYSIKEQHLETLLSQLQPR